MRNKKFLGALAFVILVLVGIAVFATKGSGKSINITAILPLTGNTAVIGQEERDGMRLALEENEPTNYKINMHFEDFQGEARQAVTAFQRAVSFQKSVAVFVSTSVGVNTLFPLMGHAKDAIFFAITTQSNLGESENVFQVWPSVKEEVGLLVSYLKKYPGAPLAVMYPTNELGIEVDQILKESVGSRIVLTLPHPMTKTDFRDDIEKIRSLPNLGKTILVAWTYPAQTLDILKLLDTYNVRPLSLVTSIGTDFPPVLDYLKTSRQSPIFAVPRYDVSSKRSQFDSRFKDKFGYSANWNVAAAYDNMDFFLNVLSNCPSGLDRQQLANHLKAASATAEFQGISGTIKMTPSHTASFPMVLVTYEKGKGIVPYAH